MCKNGKMPCVSADRNALKKSAALVENTTLKTGGECLQTHAGRDSGKVQSVSAKSAITSQPISKLTA